MKYQNLILRSLSVALFAFALGSCTNDTELRENPETNHLKSGEKCVIKLPEDHREGSNWIIQDGYDPNIIHRTGEVWHGNSKGIYFHLQARAPGATTLSLIKLKYMDTVDTKQFRLEVRHH